MLRGDRDIRRDRRDHRSQSEPLPHFCSRFSETPESTDTSDLRQLQAKNDHGRLCLHCESTKMVLMLSDSSALGGRVSEIFDRQDREYAREAIFWAREF